MLHCIFKIDENTTRRVRPSGHNFRWTQDAGIGRRTQYARRIDTGARRVDARRPQRGRTTRVLWMQDARRRNAKLFLGSTVPPLVDFALLI